MKVDPRLQTVAALVLDSDAEFVERLAERMSSLGCHIESVSAPEHLEEELREYRPACLVLDRDEPEGDAQAILGSLRASADWAAIPIFVTGRRLGTDAALAAFGAGADAALSKTRSEGMAELAARILGAARREKESTHTPVAPPVHETSDVVPDDVVPDVVVVEDDVALIEMLNYSLGNQGYELAFYSNGREALEALLDMRTGSRKPVVLLDVDLPGMDGFRVLQELSSNRPGDFQVIMATMHSSEAAQVLAIESGALDYIVKPISLPITLAKIDRLVQAEVRR
jgi:DNA-binding response OmpR family regulator